MAAPTADSAMPFLLYYGAAFDLNLNALAKQCIIELYNL